MPLMFFQSLKSAPTQATTTEYYTTVPNNSVGVNGDIAIITTTLAHYKKIADEWIQQLEPPSAGTISYVDRTSLLLSLNSKANQMASVISEPGNVYLRNASNDKWIVISGNKYATADLPTEPEFSIPIGTVIWDMTVEKHLYE